MTDNHNYSLPEKGATDWHVPLNENFEKIDTDVEIRDVEGNTAEYTPKEGAKFLATDTGRRFLGDGEQWVEATPQPRQDFAVESTTNDPTDGETGRIWYRSDTDTLKVQLDSGVESLAVGTGGTSDGTDSSSDTTDGSTATTDGTHLLEIVPADGASWSTYRIVIDGELLNTTNLNSGDTVTTQSDGTVLIEGGIKGGKRPETFEFDGTLASLSLQVDGSAVLDGQTIDPSDY
ncbi:hypothetical protein SAMN04488063_2804 [Halopelagius inordinatus]|uniref:Uncharacterized protein n=1 Tax=Halopelagius inordinatus TaxID=553467 RepID=A0A1I2U6P5_9EURY|nr:hypothetical protein [Halopelagius inordinatus]SFG72804.1 hypothetical protein SAMN04488063_2804 [Halopelagius inordinatus]